MVKPGLHRAIPMALLGFIVGALFVMGLRALQSMDPVWDPGVALILTPFTTLAFFLWGMGAFDPRMSEHAHPPHEHDEHATEGAIVPSETAISEAGAHHDEEEEAPPLALLSSQIWLVTTLTLFVIIGLFAFATLPHGLQLRTVNEAEGNTFAIEENTTFLLPLGIDTFEASQLTVFAGFIIFTMVSLFAAAGLIYLAMYYGHRGIAEVRDTEPTIEQRTPPAIVRYPARFFRWLANVLRNGLPAFLGQK